MRRLFHRIWYGRVPSLSEHDRLDRQRTLALLDQNETRVQDLERRVQRAQQDRASQAPQGTHPLIR